MQINILKTKFIIQLLVLLIISVIVFILSTFFYSIRYWPDVYNYVTAQITIKRIHTITELNLTYIDDTTDSIEWTTEYTDETTMESDKDYFGFDEVEMKKRNVDILEEKVDISSRIIDYYFDVESMNDLVDVSELTTAGLSDVEIFAESFGARKENLVTESCPGGTNDDVRSVFTWIAAIFIKNDTDQFQYYCDGAVLSKNSIITAARCVNLTLADDIIVILGKISLQEAKDTEKMIKITDVIVHENFTETSNDLAILKTEEAIETTKAISIACLSADDEYDDAVTTGWPVGEDLTAVKFDKSKSEACTTYKEICGVYNQSITFCPSHSGVFAVHSTGWYLAGIRTVTTGDHDRTSCIHKPVHYTPLRQYTEWIQENI